MQDRRAMVAGPSWTWPSGPAVQRCRGDRNVPVSVSREICRDRPLSGASWDTLEMGGGVEEWKRRGEQMKRRREEEMKR